MTRAMALLGLALAGCTSTAPLCEVQAQCMAWDEAQVDTCVFELNNDADLAGTNNCTEEHDARVECLLESGECRGEEWRDWDGRCADATARLLACRS